MRFLTLNLRAYGPFTDRTLDLSGGSEGLHLIYGNNEAGKSSTLRAIGALLYGIEKHTADNFVHEYKRLRIGAEIRRADGETLHIVRRKGNKNTLLDGEEKPLADDALLSYVGGIDAARFALLFGIGHRDLVDGGRDILAGRGGVGESLFAAALGGAKLRAVREGLEREADDLYKARGKNPPINRLLREFQQHKKQIRDSALSAGQWEAHEIALGKAQVRRKEIESKLSRQRTERHRLERLRNMLPVLARRRELRREHASMQEVLRLPPSFADERRRTVLELAQVTSAMDEAAAKREQLAEEMAAIAVPEALLAHKRDIEALGERRGRRAAASDHRRTSAGRRQQLLVDARTLLGELAPAADIERAAELRLPAAFQVQVQELIEARQGLDAAVRAAEERLTQTEAALATTTRELGALPPPCDPRPLRRAVDQARGEVANEVRLAKVRADIARQRDEALTALSGLGLWQAGTPPTLDEFAQLAVPGDAEISAHVREWAQAEAQRARTTERLTEATAAVATLERDLAAVEQAGSVPTEEELSTSRRRRDQLWHGIRGQYSEQIQTELPIAAASASASGGAKGRQETALAFEALMREADSIADRLRREAGRVSERARLVAELGHGRKGVAELEAAAAEEAAAVEVRRERWQAQWAPAGVVPLAPAAMQTWSTQRAQLLTLRGQIREDEGEAAALARRLHAVLAQLLIVVREAATVTGAAVTGEGAATATAMVTEGPAGDDEWAQTLEARVTEAAAVLAELEEVAGKRRALKERQSDDEGRLSGAKSAHEEAAGQRQVWQERWRAAMEQLGLYGEASTKVANTVIESYAELFRKLDEAEELAHTIAASDDDARAFDAQVQVLVDAVAPQLAADAGRELEGLGPERAAVQLARLLQIAIKDDSRLGELRRQYEDRERTWAASQEQATQLQATLAALCQQAHCDSVEELEQAEARSAAASALDEELARIENDLRQRGGGGTIDDLEAEAKAADADALPGQIAELDEAIFALEAERSELDREIGREQSELARMDGRSQAAVAAEQAQETLAELRASVERYMELRLASELLRREIERYRARNQGPLLERANALFAALTCEAFVRLHVEFDEKDQPVLVGERARGGRVGVDGMSDGTRDQLFLALRLATLERYIDQHEPMPLVVDDILIHFDDDRSQATLRVLAELSQKTQVLFFTHHRRLRELAESAVAPEQLYVQELP